MAGAGGGRIPAIWAGISRNCWREQYLSWTGCDSLNFEFSPDAAPKRISCCRMLKVTGKSVTYREMSHAYAARAFPRMRRPYRKRLVKAKSAGKKGTHLCPSGLTTVNYTSASGRQECSLTSNSLIFPGDLLFDPRRGHGKLEEARAGRLENRIGGDSADGNDRRLTSCSVVATSFPCTPIFHCLQMVAGVTIGSRKVRKAKQGRNLRGPSEHLSTWVDNWVEGSNPLASIIPCC